MIPQLSGNATVIHWCGLCNAAPAEGVLTILRKGELHTEDVLACNNCVKGIKDDDWLQEGKLP